MTNPGLYQSPTEGWAFIPFLGAVATFGIAVIAVLYWLAGPGRKFRLRAFGLTVLAIAAGTASAFGLIAAADSFDERHTAAFADYSTAVQEWAAEEYGVTLTDDDVIDMSQGRPAIVERNGQDWRVLLEVVAVNGDVQLHETREIPTP
ncbi:hypothetical protein I6E81_11170 [Salinibacterium sp. NG22]|uniref:hypothetical protein n=1 Tax=Salinibacterium sp. NG22 TaxID=2792040 RepID=UPI0018CC8EE2|nr:hypothetical protein [Salinibacterium sp. NG22]MBH0110728.1 hypothetical protein [Salinibacterium sp. NG22]